MPEPKRPREALTRLIEAAVARPVLTLVLVLVLALGGGLLALGLQPSTGSDTFVSRSSANYQVTADDQSHFGGDPVIVLIKEPLTDLVLTSELATVTKLEACLAGQTIVANAKLGAFTQGPASATPYGGPSSPCGQLKRANAVQVVYGPGTFLEPIGLRRQPGGDRAALQRELDRGPGCASGLFAGQGPGREPAAGDRGRQRRLHARAAAAEQPAHHDGAAVGHHEPAQHRRQELHLPDRL